MSLARPRANSLSIPIPTTALWRLCRPPTPRRATCPLPANNDIPPVPPLSFWDPETPLPFPTNSPVTTSPTSSTPTQSSCYPQPSAPVPTPDLEQSTGTPESRKLRLPPVSPYLPASPRSPVSPTSPQSPHNPFLSPPLPRWNATTLFTLASPLLPASPLSIFDRAISPTSPTFLLSRTPSPVTPNWLGYTFLRTATPSLVDEEREEESEGEDEGKEKDEEDTCADLSPTFLCPRTAPPVPRTTHTTNPSPTEAGDVQALERSYSTTPPTLNRSAATSTGAPDPDPERERKNIKVAFYHFLAARRAHAMQSPCASPPASPPSKRRLARWWEKLVPRVTVEERACGPSRRSRFSGFVSRG